MNIYNATKTKVLDNPDLKQGWLKRDRIITKTIPAVEEIQEQSHYEVVKEYFDAEGNSRGKRVKRVVDVEYQPAKPETYEYEDILVYTLYTEEELVELEIHELEERLAQLTQDFIQIQCGAVFEDEAERRKEFQEKHNRLRFLKNKEPRVYK